MNRPPVACHPHKAGRYCTYCVSLFLALANAVEIESYLFLGK
jgi:hypothetical protein